MSLQSLINYRTQLKEEGASEAHLKNYDGEINQTMLTKSEKPDISLINYRLQRTKEGASSEEIAIIDSHIFKSFGTKPARFADIKIRTITDSFYVSVDLNRETVSDLYNRVSKSLGKSTNIIKLIFKGKHLEVMDRTLYEIQLEKDSEIGLCFKLGCDGRGCCDISYNMLCDALLRSGESLINKLAETEKREFLTTFSKITASNSLDKIISQKKEQLERLEKPSLLWAEALLSSRENNTVALLSRLAKKDTSALVWEARCEALPKAALCEALPKAVTCETRYEPKTEHIDDDLYS